MSSKVKLIGVTNPVIPEAETAEDLIVYMARVSNPGNQTNMETGAKLVKYLINNKHWSPLEMVSVVMEIETTRDIARQILRHRSFSFQEFSQRYANPVEDLGFTTREVRLQDTKNRQNSIEIKDADLTQDWLEYESHVIALAREAYNWATTHHIAKEQARAFLPEGLIKSRMYMAGTLRSWVHYVEVRNDKGTQKEHREIAAKCVEILVKEFPTLKEYLYGNS